MNDIRSIYLNSLYTWYNIEFADKQANPMYAPYSYGQDKKTTGADLYLNNEKLTEVFIDSTVDELKSYVFCDFNIELISIACSVVNDYSFNNCKTPLIIFQDTVSQVGVVDLSYCCDIKLGEGITDIDEFAFSSCVGFNSVTIKTKQVLNRLTPNFKFAGCSLHQTITINIKNTLDTTTITDLTNYYEKTGTRGDCEVWTKK